MVPTFFVELDELPLTPNGKIDENALPDPVAQVDATAKPATELERDIITIWSDVLGHDRIGVNQNFFEIGGNSLRVVRVQTRLEELLGRPVLGAKLFEHFTVRSLAAYLADGARPRQESVPARSRAGDDEPIAVIGMACRLPGDVNTPEQYWELLERGGDGIVDVPKDRWDAEALYDPDPEAAGTSYCAKGGFVRDIDLFDASFFGMAPREARALDPMQRLVLETAWEAFERAGYTLDRLRGSQTGTFVGIGKSSAWREYGLTTAAWTERPRRLRGLGFHGRHHVRPGVVRLRSAGPRPHRGHGVLLLLGHHPPRLQRAAQRRMRPRGVLRCEPDAHPRTARRVQPPARHVHGRPLPVVLLRHRRHGVERGGRHGRPQAAVRRPA